MTPLKTLAQPSSCTGDTWSWRRTTPSPPPWPPCTRLASSCSGRFQKTDSWPHQTVCCQSLCERTWYFLSPYPTKPLFIIITGMPCLKCYSRIWLSDTKTFATSASLVTPWLCWPLDFMQTLALMNKNLGTMTLAYSI